MLTGRRLGPYEVLGKLGEGGMGEVYRARDTRLGRELALKVLPASVSRDPALVARFETEARAASALNHPHILHIYDVGEAEGVRYIAMELVEGETLRQRMAAGLTGETILRCLLQAGEALARAHEAGIVHRDLKPENVMVTPDGYVKLVDFGLAKLFSGVTQDQNSTVAGLSLPGTVVGTVGYMSPEQALGQPVDARTDIFSFGCVAHELLSGRAPFAGKSPIDTLHRVAHGEPDALPDAVDPALRRIVERCLRKAPLERFTSMRQVVEELGAAQPGRSTLGVQGAQRKIVVLPFEDLSPGKDSEFLGVGVAEEIITDLSSIDALCVIARSSSNAFKGDTRPLPAVARALGVEYAVTGSVRLSGERLRIAARLVHAPGELTIWAQRFDGTMNDIFDIQETVARAIAAQLRLQVSPAASGRTRARPVENVRAYECLLRARNLLYASTREALDAGLAEIDRAIEIAGPNPALFATRGLLCWQYFNSGVRPDAGMLDIAEELGREVLRLDPDSAQAQTLLGLVCVHRPDVPAAIRHLEAAVKRDPNDVDAIGWLFAQYVMTGRDERARPLVGRLAALDPVGWMATLAQPFMAMADGRFDEAVQLLDRVQVQGSFETTFRVMALCLARRFAEAEGVADEFLRRAPEDPFARIAGMYRFAIAGDRARVDELLNDSVRTVVRNDLQYSAWVAEVFALLGDAHQSAEWLRHAVSRGYLAHPYLTTHDWLFDRVRNDPAMQDVLDEMRARWMAQR